MALWYTAQLLWLEKTAVAATIRQSLWLYPALEIIHILGIVVLAGAAILFDLRLLGYAKNIPLLDLAPLLLTWSRRGLWFIIPSGFLLFSTNSVALGHDPVFWLKMILLILAGLNAWLFGAFTFRSVSTWNQNIPGPPAARAAAIGSLILWLTIIACGRLLAY